MEYSQNPQGKLENALRQMEVKAQHTKTEQDIVKTVIKLKLIYLNAYIKKIRKISSK